MLHTVHSDRKIWDLRWRSLVNKAKWTFPGEHSNCRYISHLANASLDFHLRENPTKTHRKDSISSSAIAYFQKVFFFIDQISVSFSSPTVERCWCGSLVLGLLEGFPYVWIFSTTLQGHCFMKQDCVLMGLKSILHIYFQMKSHKHHPYTLDIPPTPDTN